MLELFFCSNAYHGHHAATFAALFAITEKYIGAARSAKITYKNILRTQDRGQQLSTIGFAQIEANVFRRRLMAGRKLVEPLQRIGLVSGAQFIEPFRGIWKLGKERGGNFCANFITASTNGGADGR